MRSNHTVQSAGRATCCHMHLLLMQLELHLQWSLQIDSEQSVRRESLHSSFSRCHRHGNRPCAVIVPFSQPAGRPVVTCTCCSCNLSCIHSGVCRSVSGSQLIMRACTVHFLDATSTIMVHMRSNRIVQSTVSSRGERMGEWTARRAAECGCAGRNSELQAGTIWSC